MLQDIGAHIWAPMSCIIYDAIPLRAQNISTTPCVISQLYPVPSQQAGMEDPGQNCTTPLSWDKVVPLYHHCHAIPVAVVVVVGARLHLRLRSPLLEHRVVHASCILPWVTQSGTCPVCRQLLEEN